MTTTERTEKVSPLDKFAVLANDIDLLRLRLDTVNREQSIDSLLESKKSLRRDRTFLGENWALGVAASCVAASHWLLGLGIVNRGGLPFVTV